MDKSIFDAFDNGRATAGGETTDIGRLPWNPHKNFEGVYLKNVIPGETTGGVFACCLVRIDPGKKIGMHTHPADIELHEVIAGTGTCLTEQGDIAYTPGSMAILPANSPHEVLAGGKGLWLFAKFIKTAHE